MKRFFFNMFILLMLFSSATHAQKGTVKIFSEIKDVQFYLDEVLQGTDIIKIDSVTIGTHYLKAVKDNVIIFSELISVNQDVVTTVLVKNTKEVQEKILESKYEEIQKFKKNRLEVMMSSKYITETSSESKSTYFPGYYVATSSNVNNSYSISITKEVIDDWFVTRGGKVKITEMELARLADDQDAVKRITQVNYQIDKKNTRIKKQQSTGGIMLLMGTLSFITPLIDLLSDNFLNLNAEIASVMLAGGLVVGIIGFFIGNVSHVSYPAHYLTLEEAIRLTDIYNQNLKKSLGLPDNFEPH